ncbi:MAG TPA: LysM peptidoglycan-binding domain-containing protein [Firmicutes bacterium]|nr:LysM peptidoglycan-binding domain-containing protein [Bacillota bacterium]
MPLLTYDSPNTTRVFGRGPYQTNVAVTQLVFGRRSNAVILASSEHPLDAVAALSLVHQPIDGPVLLSHPGGLDPVVLDEVRRLAPIGAEGLAQVIMIGALDSAIEQQVASLGLSVMRLTGINAYHTAAEIARFLGYPRDVMLLSGEHPLSGLCAGAMAVHGGVPVLFTLKDALPQETVAALRASGTSTNVFIIGNRELISDKVEETVRDLTTGTVGRISAEDPFELAVRFAKYRSADGRFGFGKNDKQGHAFTFVNPGRWQDAISGAILAHMGKHTPLLFCRRDDLPAVVRDYLLRINPAQGRPEPPFMHAFIVGDLDAISASVQLEIDETISIDRKADHEVVHTVAPGDNLLQIARRYGVPIRDIASANQLSGETGLAPGSRLLIPYSVTGSPPAPPAQELH